ncbi:glycosyltransferase family 2 protein [Candidatus Endomicrobiellum devescovinae]|jgi:glycosyltransferase involved in cell wall biosynthesis|uniref:glycosyltransferase family 2 protein n=1 Tax=Candidatus Endomicrobiellum devescovinae TaxID=3242322 RepID=UPI002838BE57|nr:glycosyltransferase family 2 protein [Endomicrobium sp.]
MKKLSFIIPCYNEEKNILLMYDAVRKVINDIKKYNYEFIFVDNASTDNTLQILKNLAQKDKFVKIIANYRNFGVERSVMNAFLSASGDAIIEMACDMQDPPDLIPIFLKHWENGTKVVWGQRTDSDERFFMKKARDLYYKVIKKFSYIKQYEKVTGWGLYDRSVINKFRNLNDPMPILRNIIPDFGYDVVLVPYHQPIRLQGKSSYSLFSYFDLALSSLVHTSKVPLKCCIYLGIICSVIDLSVAIIYLIYKLLYWNTFEVGLAPLIIGCFFFFSVQILFFGLLSEYVLSILDFVNFRQYVVEKERINFED